MPVSRIRRILTCGIASALLAAVCVRGVAPALAVEPSRLPVVEGWLRLPPRGGMMMFRCQIAACGGPAALVTIYRHPEVLANITSETFMRLQEENNASDIALSQGLKSVVSLRSVSTEDGVQVFTAWQDRTQANGTRLFVLNGLLPGPAATVTVIAVAGSRTQVAANFEAFLAQLPALTR